MVSVSVVIPVYNGQQHVVEAIESALEPAVSEVVVVDDGSTDGTQAVVAALSARLADERVRYVWQSNQGVSAARNQGIAIAQSSLIAFLDADDYFLPHKIAEQLNLFTADPDLALVQSGWQRVDECGRFISEVRPWESGDDLSIESFLKLKSVLPSALMVRRDWLLKVKGFDSDLQAAEDVDLVSRLLVRGARARWLKAAAVSYRQHSHSAMGNGLIQARDLAKFLDKFFQLPDLPESVQILERSVRYHTLVWSAWYLYETGHLPDMIRQLQQAWRYSPYLYIETLIHWVDSFENFSQAGQRSVLPELIESEGWQALVRWLLTQKDASDRRYDLDSVHG